MSVQEYLNEQFPGLDSLKGGVDTQAASLKQKDEELIAKLDQLRSENVQARRENIAKLKDQFTALDSSDPIGGGNQIEDFPLLKTLPDATQGVIRENLEQIGDLKEMKGLVVQLDALFKEGDALRSETDTRNEQKVFTKVIELEESIWKVSKNSRNEVIRTLAHKGYSSSLNSIHQPYQNKVLDRFRAHLTEITWPKNQPSLNEEIFSSLLVWGLEIEVNNRDISPVRPLPLEVFKILCEPLKLRFNYHFNSERETNRLDKPEWALNHVLGQVDEYKLFFNRVVQPIIQTRKPSLLALDEFITALLPMVYSKATDSLDQLAQDHELESHWYEELINFDNSLNAKYFYQPRDVKYWKGVSGDILSQDGRFEKWLKIESQAAHAQYNDITSSPNAWDIDWESVDQYTTKPTLSSINLKGLFESVTEIYSSLRPVSFRLRFLLEIQISLLDKYYARLSESISAFESMSSTLSRAVGSVTAEDAKLVTGMNGLERLCKIYGSLDYMSSCLETWGQDLFFLELWDDISRLSSKARDKEAKKSGSAKIPDSEEEEGTLFDETLASYSKLKGRVVLSINALIRKELQAGMRDYFRFGEWSPDSPPQDISSRLHQPIQKLTKFFLFLRKFYSQNSFTLFTREFSYQMENYIWNYIIQANRLNTYGGQQIQKDLNEIWVAFMLPRNQSWNKLQQACLILSSDDRLGLPAYPSHEDLEKVEITQLTSEEVHGIMRRRL
jgi:hypothetical protein